MHRKEEKGAFEVVQQQNSGFNSGRKGLKCLRKPELHNKPPKTTTLNIEAGPENNKNSPRLDINHSNFQRYENISGKTGPSPFQAVAKLPEAVELPLKMRAHDSRVLSV